MHDQVEEDFFEGEDDEFKPFVVSDGRKSELYKIFIPNLIFTILTLGIFRFWARTRNRRYIFSRMKILGDGFEYTGTGGELFKGFLIVFVLIILPFGIIPGYYAQTIAITDFETAQAISSAQGIFFFLLFPVATYRAHRYLLSRTTWRGVRFALTGKTFGYWWRWLVCMILMPITLGLVYPKMQVVLRSYMINNVRFGDQEFNFKTYAGYLYPSFILMLFSAVAFFIIYGFAVVTLTSGTFLSTLVLFNGGELTLKDHLDTPMITALIVSGMLSILFGFCLFTAVTSIYARKVFNHFVSATSLGESEFRADIDYWTFAQFHFVNMLLSVLSLGLAYPIVACRYMGFLAENVEGFNIENIQKTLHIERDDLKTGEGLADALDAGAI